MASSRDFQCTDGGSSKFWSIEIDGNTLTVRFGKLGTAGQSNVKTFGDAAAAARAADKLVREKLGKGYVETGAKADAPEQSAKTDAPRATPKGSKEPARPAKEPIDGDASAALDLVDALTKNYPRYVGQLDQPVPLEKLEALTPIPTALRALWKWRNGGDSLFLKGSDTEGMDWLGADRAADELRELREVVESFPRSLLPCAFDGAGNFLCVEVTTNALVDWDHETRKTLVVAKQFDQYLAQLAKKIRAGKFLNGREVSDGKVDRRVTEAMKLVASAPREEAAKIIALADRARPEDGVTILRALRDALAPKDWKGPSAPADQLYAELGRLECLAKDYEAAVHSKTEQLRLRPKDLSAPSGLLWVAESALKANEVELALRGYQALYAASPDPTVAVAIAVTLTRLGRPNAAAIAEAHRAIDRAAAEVPGKVPNKLVAEAIFLEACCQQTSDAAIQRALLAALAGERQSIERILTEARSDIAKRVANAPADVAPDRRKRIGKRFTDALEVTSIRAADAFGALAAAAGF